MRSRRVCTVALAVLGALVFTAAANAETLGLTSQPSPSSVGTCNSGSADAQSAQDPSTPYFVPSDGTITQWGHVIAGGEEKAGDSLEFIVLRPTTGGYTVVGTDTETLPSPLPANGTLVSFPLKAPISVKTGDTLGLYSDSSGVACYFGADATPSGDEIDAIGFASDPPTTGEATTFSSPTGPGYAVDVTATFVAPSPPRVSITSPVNGATYAQGQVVDSSFTCVEGVGGTGIASCVDQNGHSSGSPINTSTTGSHTYTVTATSKDGLTGEASITYTVAALGVVIKHAKINSKHHTAKFSFKAIGPATGLQCALVKPKKHDKHPKPSFSSCDSPKLYKHLKAGKYTFDVRAVSGTRHSTPASKHFTIT